MVVIGIIVIMLIALVPAMNSVSKSSSRKGAMNILLGAFEQARSQAIKDGQATYVVFPDSLPSGVTEDMKQQYQNHSYAIFQDDAATPGIPKQLTPWRILPTGVSIRSNSLNYLANSIAFLFTPAGAGKTAPFPFLKFNASGEVDPSTTRNAGATSGTIQFGIFEGFVASGGERDTSSSKFTETIVVHRLTGRASRAP